MDERSAVGALLGAGKHAVAFGREQCGRRMIRPRRRQPAMPDRIGVIAEKRREPDRDLLAAETEQIEVAFPLAPLRIARNVVAQLPHEPAVELLVAGVKGGPVASRTQVPERREVFSILGVTDHDRETASAEEIATQRGAGRVKRCEQLAFTEVDGAYLSLLRAQPRLVEATVTLADLAGVIPEPDGDQRGELVVCRPAEATEFRALAGAVSARPRMLKRRGNVDDRRLDLVIRPARGEQ